MKRNSSAFTLVETMVALAIFSLVIVASVSAISEIGDVVATLRMEGEARRSLENRAAELRGLRPFPPVAKTAGPLTATNGVTLREDITQIEDAAAKITAADRLFEVKLVATWRERGSGQALTNTLYLRGTQ